MPRGLRGKGKLKSLQIKELRCRVLRRAGRMVCQIGSKRAGSVSEGEASVAYASGSFAEGHFGAFRGTLNTTSAEPMLPAASRTRRTSTWVPGFRDSV